MKTPHSILCILAMTTLLRADPVQPEPITAAVLNFQTSGMENAHSGAEVAVLLNARLSAAPDLILVEREELDKVLGEQAMGLSGTVTPETAAKVGNLVGAHVLITGRLFDAGGKQYIVAKIIGTETGRVYGELAEFDDPAQMDKAVEQLALEIHATIQRRGDTLLAKVEDPSERLARLKKIIAGKTLPSVSVNITEQHVNHAVIDPAAQTEVKLTLQQLGFEVVESGKEPQVAISGEGFSELGMRKGGLTSCRARLEIKVLQTGTGKLLLSDIQADTAVDISEDMAGKTALQNAALKLLDRIVPSLVAQ